MTSPFIDERLSIINYSSQGLTAVVSFGMPSSHLPPLRALFSLLVAGIGTSPMHSDQRCVYTYQE